MIAKKIVVPESRDDTFPIIEIEDNVVVKISREASREVLRKDTISLILRYVEINKQGIFAKRTRIYGKAPFPEAREERISVIIISDLSKQLKRIRPAELATDEQLVAKMREIVEKRKEYLMWRMGLGGASVSAGKRGLAMSIGSTEVYIAVQGRGKIEVPSEPEVVLSLVFNFVLSLLRR